MSFSRVRVSLAVAVAVSTLATVGTGDAAAQQVVNLYTSRHYESDQKLYDSFTQQTGIEVRRCRPVAMR